MLNLSFKSPARTGLRITIFERVASEEREKVHSVYDIGCYISLSTESWVTTGHRKWFRVCGILRSLQDGRSTIDTRRFEDITVEDENEFVVCRELKQEINSVLEFLGVGAGKSTLGCVITDSAKPNIAAFPQLLFLPCHAHQLNLLAGNILTHSATIGVVSNAIDLINFFHGHPKQKARFQDIMEKRTRKPLEFVQYGNTPWYSNYQIMLRLFRARKFLEEYKSSIADNDPIHQKKFAARALDTIGARLHCVFFSAPGTAADLERIWSSCFMNLTSRRQALTRENVLKTFEIKTEITTQCETSDQLALNNFRERNAEKAPISDLLGCDEEESVVQSQQS